MAKTGLPQVRVRGCGIRGERSLAWERFLGFCPARPLDGVLVAMQNAG
jgi:hypothetical protein